MDAPEQYYAKSNKPVGERQTIDFTYMSGGPQKAQNLFIKNCAFVLTCLNFTYLQSTLHLMQYTYGGFSPLLKTVFELDFDAFYAPAFYRFTSSTSGTHFPLRTFFI